MHSVSGLRHWFIPRFSYSCLPVSCILLNKLHVQLHGCGNLGLAMGDIENLAGHDISYAPIFHITIIAVSGLLYNMGNPVVF